MDTADEATGGSREIVERIAAGIGADVTISARERDGVVTVSAAGADVALFIGKHGQTIDAIQYLANAITRTHGGEHEVVVDAAGYRARRTATLEGIARRTAQRVAATGRRAELEPMTPVERKIVHEALKDDPGVETAQRGLGAEPLRRRAAAAHRGLARWTGTSSAGSRSCSRRRVSPASPIARLHGACFSTTRCAPPRSSSGFPVSSSTSARAAERPVSRWPRAFPERSFTLLEAERRKCDFLERVTASLDNVTVVWGRAEEQPTDTYGIALAKALAKPPVAAELCLPLVVAGRCRDPVARRIGGSRRGGIRRRHSSTVGSRRIWTASWSCASSARRRLDSRAARRSRRSARSPSASAAARCGDGCR